MYLPPVLRPLPSGGPITPAVQRIAEAPVSVVRGAPGSYVAERLAGAIDNWQRLGDCVWLRAGDSLPADNVVEYGDRGYRVNPELQVEVDVERFDRNLRTAEVAERTGDREVARTAYQQAISLYRGDFAADAPFEQWTLLPRESLRIKLVDALDRLSRIELADHRIDDCIGTAHHMLDIDPCREDAHRLLMRCYATQGRIYHALRQYEFCSRILRATIDASPAPVTTDLYRVIRTGSAEELAKLR